VSRGVKLALYKAPWRLLLGETVALFQGKAYPEGAITVRHGFPRGIYCGRAWPRFWLAKVEVVNA